MGILEKARDRFVDIVAENSLSGEKITIAVRGLEVQEAIGDPERDDYPLLRGEEVMIEATYGSSCGQAFTDRPDNYRGTIDKLVDSKLTNTHDRALLVAAMNAVLSELGMIEKTRHCRDDQPEKCGEKIVAWLQENWPEVERVGIVGYQPAIVAACIEYFGPKAVQVSDLNPQTIFREISSGVVIKDGLKVNQQLIASSDFVLATGSTLVNGSIDELIEYFQEFNSNHAFFGNTVAAAAWLVDLPRLCFYAD